MGALDQGRTPSLPDDLIGQVVAGRYRVLDRLGAGGMGTVYLAEHQAIEKKVALKVLRPEYSSKPDLVTRFQREAISASRIKHPNVLDVFDFGQLENGCFYLAMEFLEGHDLADELDRATVIRPDRAIRIVLQICKALATAHARGVVHRDMKPENVFLQISADGEEQIKIVDFGIAQLRSNEELAESEHRRRRLTRTGMIFGTPEYMSPEQAAGRHMDLRVDVYATGVILYEMLTGAVPFTGDTFFGVLNAHMNDPVPPIKTLNPTISVSPELEAVIGKALAKQPADRYQSMREIAAALLATPEGLSLDPYAQKSIVPAVTLAEFDAAASAREAVPAPAPTRAAPAVSAISDESNTLPAARLDTGRADTLVAEERAAPPPAPRRRVGLWALGGLAVLLLGGAVAVRLLPVAPAPRSSAEPATPLTAAQVVPVATESSRPVVQATAAPVPAAAIQLSVVTEPAGSTLLKNGFQVCDTTPCVVAATPNESIELEARKGALRGKAKVLAQRDQRVEIKLAAPSAGAAPVWCYREVEKDGLKTLEKFRCPGQ